MLNIDTGFIYKWFIDPILSPIHASAHKYIKADSKIVDIACGTGSFALRLAKDANFVTGFDLSESMVRIALKRQKQYNIVNTSFQIKDASDLTEYEDKTFDYATISMAIHQFRTALGIKILSGLKRISREIIIIDYAYPLPKNRYKTITYLIERMAGKEHFSCFKEYQAIGGISTIAKKAGITINDSKIRGNGIFIIASCSEI